MPGPEVLTVGDLSGYTGYTEGTILNYSSVGKLPPPDKLLNATAKRPIKLWFPATIDAWMKEKKR